MTEYKLLLEAESHDRLVRQLNDLRAKLPDASRPKPGEKHDELWYLCHYLPKVRKLEFPVKVWRGESPDFMVESGTSTFGLEMTSVHSGIYKQNEAEYRKYGMTDGPHFAPPPDRLVGMKSETQRKNLERGADEFGSALGRTVGGEISPDEIRAYVDEIAFELVKKTCTVANYKFQSPITIVVSIESTHLRRYVTWDPESMEKESMAEIFFSLAQATREVIARHLRISDVCFICYRRLLMVPRHGTVYCANQRHCLPIDQYLAAVYSEERAFE